MGTMNLGRVRGTYMYAGAEISGDLEGASIMSDSDVEYAYAGDLYLNTDDTSDYKGCVYTCVTGGEPEEATWILSGNIRGAQGEVVDSLESESTTIALSANQGRVLNEALSDLSDSLDSFAGGLAAYDEDTETLTITTDASL